jgi:tetratricopeptide (TPR) repeat protein
MNKMYSKAVATLALALGLALAGCAEQSSHPDADDASPRPAAAASAQPACACEDEPVVDPTLLSFLSMARAAHHKADLEVEAGDRAAAIAALERVVKAPWQGKRPPEVVEVTADTLARLADLRSEDGKFEEAARDVTEGIALAIEPTHFRGRLFEVRGLVEERRSKALKEKGDSEGAERARKAAVESFRQAMDIQEDVIARALKQKDEGEK